MDVVQFDDNISLEELIKKSVEVNKKEYEEYHRFIQVANMARAKYEKETEILNFDEFMNDYLPKFTKECEEI